MESLVYFIVTVGISTLLLYGIGAADQYIRERSRGKTGTAEEASRNSRLSLPGGK